MLEEIRRRIPDRELCHLVPFTTTQHERDLALTLGIPLYGADPRHLHFGTKTGCRRLFERPASRTRWAARASPTSTAWSTPWSRCAPPGRRCARAIVKHNDGVAGRGNARRRPAGPARARLRRRAGRAARARASRCSSSTRAPTSPSTCSRLAEGGGIVEEHIGGVELRSPSVQLRISPLGEVEVLSTHDQLLGGRSGQTLPRLPVPRRLRLRARDHRGGDEDRPSGSPARACSAASPSTSSSSATPRGSWTPYAIELNLRKGGTTHPFLTLQFLTDGTYDPGRRSSPPRAGARSTSSRPTTSSRELLRGLSIHDLFDIAVRHRLHFDPARQVGVVFHMMSALTELGRTGHDRRRRHARAGGRRLPAG